MMTEKPMNALGVDVSRPVVVQRQHLATITRQKQRRRQTGRASADDDAIENIHVSNYTWFVSARAKTLSLFSCTHRSPFPLEKEPALITESSRLIKAGLGHRILHLKANAPLQRFLFKAALLEPLLDNALTGFLGSTYPCPSGKVVAHA